MQDHVKRKKKAVNLSIDAELLAEAIGASERGPFVAEQPMLANKSVV